MKYNDKANLETNKIYTFKADEDTGLYTILNNKAQFTGRITEEYDSHYQAIVLTDNNHSREISISINKANLHCGLIKTI